MLSTLTLSALFIGTTFSKLNLNNNNHKIQDESLLHKDINKFKQHDDSIDDGSDNDGNLIEIHNSCINLDDGMFYIKPTEEGPVIPVICSKSYTMIDISLHFGNIAHYFSSYDYSKSDTYIIGPELDDMVSWREWWTPADDTYLFRTATNCHACYPDETWESNAAYYMSSYYFCFSTAMEPECPDGIPNEGFDQNACAWCDDGKGKSAVSGWTKCTSLRFNADEKPNADHYNCVTHELVYRPSAVSNRDACTCYKESDKKTATTYWVKPSDLPPVTIPEDLDDDIIIDPLIIIAGDVSDDDDSDTEFENLPITYLSQEDFIGGTFRISERGEYILTENIVISFNEPSDEIQSDPDFSPNAYDLDDLYWYPRHDQDEKYPGLYTYHGKFTLGFFAAISIETDDVIINLNGFSISMDYKFYFQQRFFSLIELGNQPFIGGQGPANWGADQLFASNVIIKDGILGLSSHHAIHGNHNNNILISNVRMTQFDVAGFGCNACIGVEVTDCIIGPQNTNIPVLGRYTHARAFLPRIQSLVDQFGTESMSFADREPILVQDLADRLVNQMDMIYNHMVNGVQYDEDDEEWQATKTLFYNPTGWMDGGSSYGLVFNGDGAAVIGIGCRTGGTSDITVNNVEIYGIYTQPIEKPKFQSDGAIRLSFFDGLDWPAVTEGIEDPYTATYIGDAYTDLVFTVNHFVDSWYYLNSLRITPAMTAFAETGETQAFGDEYEGVCGSDIQLHSSKGAIGLRIDGTQNINLNNIYVHDVQNWGALGIDLCGQYHYPTVSHEDPQIQYGYTGNRAQGIIASYASGSMTDITIENIESYYGSAWGMVLYKGNEFGLSNINVKSVYAGTQLTAAEAQALVLPNYMPLACSVELRDEAIVTSINGYEDFADIVGQDVIGHKLCNNPTNNYGDLLGACDIESCHMYDGDTMTGQPEGSTGTGGDRVETAPVSIDPPSDPLIYDSDADDTQFTDIAEIPEGSIGIKSACNDLEDGLQYILPYGTFDEDTAPLLPVICNAGNTILDPSLNFNRYQLYFTSLYMYDVGIAGPDLDDFSTWREWYLPLESSDDFVYGVSDDCSSTCLTDPATGDKSVYYMTGNFYLCAWITKGDCDMDAETYECYQCARNGGRSSSVYPGVCSHVSMNADYEVHDDHFQCTGNNDNLKPSIGLMHQYCVCYNPTNSGLHQSVVIDEDTYNTQVTKLESEMEFIKEKEANDAAPVIDDGSNNIVYLSQQDFLYGTYRITEPGIYILTENIYLNFNAPTAEEMEADDFSPNSYEDFHWMPRTDGSQDDQYMGASTWNGPYQLGFFTGVTVETSNVVIDLNGFEIAMSDEFYLQQRFFSIFELAAKNFVAGQGPVDFGPYLKSAQNVVIKNGIIGKATHHGIHANDARGVTLQDLQIHDFDVAGIQLNGFDDITITDCDIGPSSSNIPVTGRYLHARTLLRRFGHLVDNYGDETLTFQGRETQTVREYVDELIAQMDMVYNHVINGYEYTEDDIDYDRWLKASDLFINPNENGYGDGGVVYGILLNSRGGAVMGFGNAPSQSTNAVVENVYIHDLAISPLEKLKFKTNPLGGATRGPVADVFDIMKVADQWDDVSTAKYIGTAYSDVQIAMSQFEKSWFVLDHTCFDEGIVSWAIDGTSFDSGYYGGCNTDIQLHINKGVIGLRIDNIVGFDIKNVQIENLVNTGVLGTETDVCGAYTQGNAHQDPLITAGYTGTEGYGVTITQSTQGSLTDVSIKNLETHYGFATGVAVFKDSSVEFAGELVVDNIVAGSQMQMEYLRPAQDYLPNKIPMACSVYDNNYNTEYTLSGSIAASNVNGYLMCSDEAMIGECDDISCAALYEQEYFDQLSASYHKVLGADTQQSDVNIFSVSDSGKTVYGSLSKSLLHIPTFATIAVTLLMILVLVLCYRWSSPYSRIGEKTIRSNVFNTEYTPLLNK